MYILNTRGSSIETVALHCLTFFAFFAFDHDVVVIVYVSIKETSTCISVPEYSHSCLFLI